MGALPVIADTFRLDLRWLAAGQNAHNVMHFRKSGAHPSDLAAIMNSSVVVGMWMPMDSDAVAQDMAITPLDGISATVTLPCTTPAHWTGQQTASGYDFIPQVAGIVHCPTAKRGRSYRGRVYLPFINEHATSQGQIVDTSVMTAWQSGWTAWLAAIIAGGWDFVVASYKHSVATSINGVVCESVTGTQRRRQGRNR